MIISHKYKFIYIRIPKTGSTSVEQFLISIDPDCIRSDETTPPYGHHTASQLKRIVGDEVWSEYFTFTFVRNPYDWIASQYSYNMQYYHRKHPQLHILLDSDKRLRMPHDGVLQVHDIVKVYAMLAFWFQGGTQSTYVDIAVNYIASFDRIDEHMTVILHHLGITTSAQLPVLNQSTKLTLSPRAKDRVLCSDDFSLINNNG